MTTDRGLAALVLAAGRGTRLRPLTDTVPKPLLEVGGRTLLDLALDRVGGVVPLDEEHVAVNAHWLADLVAAHVAGRAHVSREAPEALGTAGAVGLLRGWVAGRDLLVTNADAWCDPQPDLRALVEGWDGARPRLLVVEDPAHADFDGRWRFAGTSLLPWPLAAALEPVPSGLYEAVWSRVPIDLVPVELAFVDCGTPDDLALARSLAGRRGGPQSRQGPLPPTRSTAIRMSTPAGGSGNGGKSVPGPT